MTEIRPRGRRSQMFMDGFRVSGFKGFQEITHIPLKPVTMLFGPNNGGKSSILKSFASVEQSAIHRTTTGASENDWVPKGIWFDLGYPAQFINRDVKNRSSEFTIGYSYIEIKQSFQPPQWKNEHESPVMVPPQSPVMVPPRTGFTIDYTIKVEKTGEGVIKEAMLGEWNGQISTPLARIIQLPSQRFRGQWCAIPHNADPDELIHGFNQFEKKRKLTTQAFTDFRRKCIARLKKLPVPQDDLTWEEFAGSPHEDQNVDIWKSRGMMNRLNALLFEVLGQEEQPARYGPTRENARNHIGSDTIKQYRDEVRAIWKGVISPHLLGIENFLGDFSCFLVPNRFGRQWRHQRVLQASLRRDCTGEHIMLRKYNWDFSTVSVEFGRDDDDSEENMSEWAISARNLIDNFRKSHHGWKQLEYLSATRLKPQRFYEVGVKGERLDGGFTMHALLTDTTLKNKVNTALDDILGVKIYTKQLSSQFSTSGKTNLYDVRVGKQAAKAKLQLPDVGFGISQLLPVLVSMQRTDHLLLVEEPESNLHPKAQTHLIETILNSVDKDSGPSILMETHSEHFLVRVLQLIESGQISDEDISIIYVDTDSENGTTVKHIRTKDGVMVDEMPKALSHLENFTNSIL